MRELGEYRGREKRPRLGTRSCGVGGAGCASNTGLGGAGTRLGMGARRTRGYSAAYSKGWGTAVGVITQRAV